MLTPMKNDGDYARSVNVTLERMAASLLVTTWMILAYVRFGFPLAVRTFIFYLLPLAFIWIPDLMSKLDWRSNQDPTPSLFIPPNWLRLAGWLLILAVPAAWITFFKHSCPPE